MHYSITDDAVIIKNRVWEGYETKVGAHYYAYSPYKTGYSKVMGHIILPYKLYTGNRNAYISFGVLGINGSIDIGIMNGGNGWKPYYYDIKNKYFQSFNEFTPFYTTIVFIQVEVFLNRKIGFSITYRNNNLDILKSFNLKIDGSHILEYEGGKVKNRFYRFVSLVPNGIDNQNDGTYMIRGTFNNLIIINKKEEDNWGIDYDNIDVAWKVSSNRIDFEYYNINEYFNIKHYV